MSASDPASPTPPPPIDPLDGPFPGGLKRFLFPSLFVLLMFGALWYRRPAPAPKRPTIYQVQGRIFGTTYAIKVVATSRQITGKKLLTLANRTLQQVDKEMSTYRKDSQLSRFNRSPSLDPFRVSPSLAKVVAESKRITALTHGAFDVTIGPVVNVWGFGPNKRLKPPTPAMMLAAKKRTGANKLSVNLKARTLQKTRADLYIDLSAIAKGYAVDALAAEIEKTGNTRYMVEVGGEVRAKGNNARGGAWRIGIEKPKGSQQQHIQLVVPLRDAAMATSGNYRNYIMVGGQKVSHLIDARTSKPVAHALASVTVIHPSCMTADALATALYVLGPKDGLALAEEKDLAVLFLVPQGQAFVQKASTAFRALLKAPARQRPSPRTP